MKVLERLDRILSNKSVEAFDIASIDEKIQDAKESGNLVLLKRLEKLKQHFESKE